MTRQDFTEKYSGVISSMFVASGRKDDISVCVDKLFSSIRGHFGETFKDGAGVHVFEEYAGIPEEFDWDEAYEDYKSIIEE